MKQKKYNKQKNVSNHNAEKTYEDIVMGRNSVMELLSQDKDVNKLFIQKGEKHGSINKIILLAKEKKIVCVEVEKSKLDIMSDSQNHQGVIAIVPPFNYSTVDEILALASVRKEDPFILLLDGIEDMHNLGSIIRTAETAGVHGIILPKRRSALVNSTVVKTSSGATAHMKIARVNNLTETIKQLKSEGLWVVGTEMNMGNEYYNQDLKGPICIVIGSEGFGISRLVKENIDIFIKIPMKGKITSLNASVSTGIVVYEVLKQREKIF